MKLAQAPWDVSVTILTTYLALWDFTFSSQIPCTFYFLYFGFWGHTYWWSGWFSCLWAQRPLLVMLRESSGMPGIEHRLAECKEAPYCAISLASRIHFFNMDYFSILTWLHSRGSQQYLTYCPFSGKKKSLFPWKSLNSNRIDRQTIPPVEPKPPLTYLALEVTSSQNNPVGRLLASWGLPFCLNLNAQA